MPRPADVDQFRARFGDGGKPGRCGWLEDRYGVSWQVVPKELLAMIGDADPVRRGRAMTVFLPMGKPELATIRRAFEGGGDEDSAASSRADGIAVRRHRSLARAADVSRGKGARSTFAAAHAT